MAADVDLDGKVDSSEFSGMIEVMKGWERECERESGKWRGSERGRGMGGGDQPFMSS